MAWTTVPVKRRKPPRSSRRTNKVSAAESAGAYTVEEYGQIYDQVVKLRTTLKDTMLWSKVVEVIDQIDTLTTIKVPIVAYGLGSFQSANAVKQLACLLNLGEVIGATRIEIFDPVMTPLDITLVEKFGCTYIRENESCKRVASSLTLFFIPHGDLFMYSNLLMTNTSEDTLQNLLLFGNSLASYVDHETQLGVCSIDEIERGEKTAAIDIIRSVLPRLNEIVIHKSMHNNFPPKRVDGDSKTQTNQETCHVDYGIPLDGCLERAFNDTSFHSFERK